MIGQLQAIATGQRIVGAQHRADRVGAQLVHRQAGLVERPAGQGDIDQSGAQPAAWIGQVGVADADLDARVPPPVCGGQPRRAPVGAVAQHADGDGRGTRRHGHPHAYPVGLVEQGTCLAQQRGPGRSERDARGGPVQQHGAEIGLKVLDRPTQRRLAHVQTSRGPPEVQLLGDGHEIPKQAQVHHIRRYPYGIASASAGR
jgi:hypothetical protein